MNNLIKYCLSIGLSFVLGGTPVVYAQTNESAIAFKDISFSEALKQAKSQGKLVFVDCYTSWCAPCKWMEQNVFVNDSVYTFFNNHFINYKVDMEKGEGIELRKRYGVNSFPTYLFVNNSGEVVHRTASRMSVGEFLKEGQNAVDPTATYAYLKSKYESGDHSSTLLFEYVMVLRKVDRNQAEKVEKELLTQLSDNDLKSELGWQVINNMARNENDRLGKFLFQNKAFYEKLAGAEAVKTVEMRLGVYTMNSLIRSQDSTAFFTRLNKMKNAADPKIQRDVAMLEMDYYLTANQPEAFVATANEAMAGILEFNDADLSFTARRANYMAKGNQKIMHQALVMARKAALLNPEEYSNQGTLASICLELRLKEEGLRAAKKARELSNDITSKIQKLAQDLVDKIEQL